MRKTSLILFLAAVVVAPVLRAQAPAGPSDPQLGAPEKAAAQTAAPGVVPAAAAPAPRTARLSWFHGNLQIQRADNTALAPTPDNLDPDSAVANMPIAQGSRLVTGDDSEAEIEFEDGSVARLTPKTALTIDSLTADGKVADTRLSLLGGLAYFELRHGPTATYTISAGSILASPADNVVFRIALEEPPAMVSVLSGALTVSAANDPDAASQPGFTATVKAGESLHADPEDATRYFLNPQLADSTWDAWNQNIDNDAATQAATRTSARDEYAGTEGYGWSDLDASGTWYTVTNPDGSTSELWQPTIAADPGADDSAAADTGGDADAFDPYGDGAFVYSGGAYFWASSYPWGWLPYRCGRWNYYPQFGWAWSPNRFCRVWGFGAGSAGVNIGRHPPRYKVIQFPPITPVHPIVRVHTSDPRPKAPRKDNPVPVRIAGATATPLAPVPAPAFAADGFAASALYRDYPVQDGSRKPVLGSITPPATEPTAPAGWVATAPATAAPRIARTPGGASYLRPAIPIHTPAPAAAPRAAPAPAAAPAAPGKPK